MSHEHHYTATVTWTGNQGTGTSGYTAYSRNHTISIEGKPDISGSSDAAFRGDKSRYSPEDSFVAAISACHMLWYLHLCAVNNVVVEKYVDQSSAVMTENENGSGQFRQIILKPVVTIQKSEMADRAISLHKEAHDLCFLARSVNFEILHEPVILTQ